MVMIRIHALLADILGLEPAEVPRDADRLTFPTWDSLSHLQLICAIEQEYGLRMSMTEINELRSIPALAERVAR
jgi:acyl carrier protein